MSQTELSEKSGVSRQVINSIENNEEVNTTTKTLSTIAEALDCTIADLLCRNRLVNQTKKEDKDETENLKS